ncbi:MAG: maleylpyruvate isomerase family mycothiol-dependent enzyme [Actinobacteria bacterium]|nr:maleylpyruvate isomerase family mycothiol-dependent enzyme [Actinomycetota bacterium]
MTIPTDTIDKLEETYRNLSELGATLTEEQWKTPSDLPGWTVQDNLSHLIGTESTMQGLARGDHRAPEVDYVKNPIGRMNEDDVDIRRSRSGAEVLAEWNDVVAMRLATLRSADDAYFEAPAMTPTGPGTVADFLHIRVLDCWSHEQDIRRALGLPGSQDNASATHTIDRLVRTLPIVVGKRAGTAEGDAVTIHLTGPIERSLTYEVIEGRATQVAQPSKPAVATISFDSDAFATLALGRRTATQMAERIAIEGDRDLGQRVVDQLNMMI